MSQPATFRRRAGTRVVDVVEQDAVAGADLAAVLRRQGVRAQLASLQAAGQGHGVPLPLCRYRTNGATRNVYIPTNQECGYTRLVLKTTIQFDPAKRDAVAAVLGTKGLKATVDAAFDAVLRQHAGRELVRLAQDGEIELTNEEVESQAWGA